MGQALFVLVVVMLFAVAVAIPMGLTVVVFLTARALVVPSGRRRLAGLGLGAALAAVAVGLALFFGAVDAFPDTQCPSAYRGTRNLEAASIEQSSGFWPPGLRCRYEFADGLIETYRPDFDAVWVAAAMTAVFGAAMGVVVVGRQFSKNGDMLF
jgi:hypothetical protein